MSSLRICLHRSWVRLDPSALVPWSLDCLRDLRWWLRGDRFSRGVPLLQVSPVLAFWSDTSDVCLGPHLGDRVVSGLWDQSEALLPVHARELLAVRHGLLHFQSFLSGTMVAVFCGNVTTVPYLLNGGGGEATGLLLSTPLPRGSSVGRNLFGFDWLRSAFRGSALFSRTLSRPHQLPSSAWSLNLDVFRSLRRRWPVMFDLCATSDHHRFSIFSCPTETLSRRGRTRSSSPGTVFWRALFRRGPFFPGCWRSLGCLTGPSSPSTGLSVLGSWTSSSCRWLLQCLFQRAQTSSSSLGLIAATRVSTGWPFMPGDCPAPHQGGWFLLGGGCAGFVSAPSFIAPHLPAQVVGFPVMVPLSGPLHLAAIPLQGSRFPLVASIGSGP